MVEPGQEMGQLILTPIAVDASRMPINLTDDVLEKLKGYAE